MKFRDTDLQYYDEDFTGLRIYYCKNCHCYCIRSDRLTVNVYSEEHIKEILFLYKNHRLNKCDKNQKIMKQRKEEYLQELSEWREKFKELERDVHE